MACPQLETEGWSPPTGHGRAALCLALERWSRGLCLGLPHISQFEVSRGNARVRAPHTAPVLP